MWGLLDIVYFLLGLVFVFAFGLYIRGAFDFDEWIKDYYDEQ